MGKHPYGHPLVGRRRKTNSQPARLVTTPLIGTGIAAYTLALAAFIDLGLCPVRHWSMHPNRSSRPEREGQ